MHCRRTRVELSHWVKVARLKKPTDFDWFVSMFFLDSSAANVCSPSSSKGRADVYEHAAV
jgi:hypothetical protein